MQNSLAEKKRHTELVENLWIHCEQAGGICGYVVNHPETFRKGGKECGKRDEFSTSNSRNLYGRGVLQTAAADSNDVGKGFWEAICFTDKYHLLPCRISAEIFSAAGKITGAQRLLIRLRTKRNVSPALTVESRNVCLAFIVEMSVLFRSILLFGIVRKSCFSLEASLAAGEVFRHVTYKGKAIHYLLSQFFCPFREGCWLMKCRNVTGLLYVWVLGLTGLFVGPAVVPVAAQNWTRFRGENGAGISRQKGVPITWTEKDYAWKVTLPGIGHSSPVIWNNRLFVTSAVDEGELRYLFCLDARNGKILWSRLTGLSPSHKHKKSSWASATPAVDGERVYVAFADKENYFLAAYDFDGQLVWRRNLGRFESQHGQGVSPIVYKELVIMPNDQDGPSSILAVNRKTGETVWSTLRSVRRTSYATPMIFREPGRKPQLICSSGAMGVTSLDPDTGRLNWMTGEFPLRTVASPIEADGLIIQSCGGGGVGKLLIAVDPHGQGDVSTTHIKYRREKTLPYVPTPVYYEGHVYLWDDNGVVSCMEASTGRNIWTKRVGGNYSGSPICIDGKLYAISEEGNVVVLAASPRYRLLGKTNLGDFSHATPAVAHGRLYLRTFKHLFCLEARE